MSPLSTSASPAFVVPLFDGGRASPASSPELRRGGSPFSGAKLEAGYEALSPHDTSEDDLSTSRIKYERTVSGESGSRARRAWLGLLLVVAGLLCADLWRGVAPGLAGAVDVQAAEMRVNKTVAVVAPVIETVVVTDHYGYNLEEKTVILFVHHDTPDANANTRFFLQHALHDRADFVFILNGESELRDEIPDDLPNVQVVQRDNTCYDLGAHGEVLQANDRELVKKYDKFVLMNASVRGPFMPRWSRECWTNAFTDKVTDDVKLVGLTMNCYEGRDHSFAIKPDDPAFDPVHKLRHLQAMLLATDRTGIDLLLDPLGLAACHDDYKTAVGTELHLTNLIWQGGYEVEALMNMWDEEDDFAERCTAKNPTMYYAGGYLPLTETLFTKTKKLPKGIADKYSQWARHYSSYDHCPVY